ncbi:hypothetical protein [Actinomadura sp. HBU206391]|uniref:hypothetical protein n=1 Tax=Actinomadura sp. HBU206391 TaxID=2731692 RepID=UPI0016505026|nr:hypothetical protein [Actinomadura sp. HBU206391]MBC6458779.1 hypothetical protein [Actinomadura sp. HBU206391]
MIALTAVIGGLMFVAYLANLWVFQRATRNDPLTTSAQSSQCLLARRYVGVYVRRP